MLRAPLGTGELVPIGDSAHVTVRGETQFDRCGTALAVLEWPLIDGQAGIDLAVSAPGAGSDRGWVTIFDGGPDGGQFQNPGVLELSDADLRIEGGERNVHLGRAIDAGDVDGDGRSDLVTTVAPGINAGGLRVIANPGVAFNDAVIGIDDSGVLSVVVNDELAVSDSSRYALHVRQHHPVGHRLWGDGADLLFGHGQADANGLGTSGFGALVPGRSDYTPADPYIREMSSAFHLKVVGQERDANMGSDLESADLTDDGRPELVVGAPRMENGFEAPGAVLVLAGGSPYAWDHAPQSGDIDVSWDHQTSVRLYDDIVTGGTDDFGIDWDEGIDELGWEIWVNNARLTDTSMVRLEVPDDVADQPELARWKQRLVVDWPDTLHPYLQQEMSIRAVVRDRAGHEVVTRWDYSLVEDWNGPEIVRGSTAPGEPQWPGEPPIPLKDRVSLLPGIGCVIADDASLDSTSIELRLGFDRAYAGNVFRDTLALPLAPLDIDLGEGGRSASVYHQLDDEFFLQDLGVGWSPDSVRTQLVEGDTVTVIVSARDGNGRPLENPTSWQFITIYEDVTPPYIAQRGEGVTVPVIGADEVPADEMVVLQINDDEAGLFVNSYKDFCPSCFTPEEADLVLSDAEKEQLWPRVYRLFPRGGGTVDTVNVTLKGDPVAPYPSDPLTSPAWNLTCTNGRIGVYRGFRCVTWSYVPEPAFTWGDTVEFLVVAKDLYGNQIPAEPGRWWFTTPADNDPPILCDSGPGGPLESTQPNVFFDVRDDAAGDESGLDFGSVQLEEFRLPIGEEWREPTPDDWRNIEDWTVGVVNDPVGCFGGESIRWTPGVDDVFTDGDSVAIRFSVADLAGNAMEEPAMLGFRAVRDAVGPAIVIELRRNSEVLGRSSSWAGRPPQSGYDTIVPGVIPGDSLNFKIILKEESGPDTGIDPSTIQVKLDFHDTEVSLVSGGQPLVGGILRSADPDSMPEPPGLKKVIYNLEVASDYRFPSGQSVVVAVRADDIEADGQNRNDGQLVFVTGLETSNRPVPRVITPNAGVQTSTTIVFSMGANASSSLKVFNVVGERIALVEGVGAGDGNIVFVWHGTGGTGSSVEDGGVVVPGGIYVYQYDAGDRVVSGTIGVLR